jgi:hypothetical protein
MKENLPFGDNTTTPQNVTKRELMGYFDTENFKRKDGRPQCSRN